MAEMQPKSALLELIAANQDVGRFREMLWEGTFAEYLDMVKEDPNICRNAYQRLYDLIASFGSEEYTEYKKKIVRYKFFDDPFENGKDAVFGIDIHLMKLVRVLARRRLAMGLKSVSSCYMDPSDPRKVRLRG